MSETRNKILNAAERLTQTRGFNGFSYIDLSREVGVKTSSIHYHFRVKADLGLALVEMQHEALGAALSEMDSQIEAPEERLTVLVDAFQNYSSGKKFCLCGMLAAELASVSSAVEERLRDYFRNLQAWIAAQFEAMRVENAEARALSFLSALEGSVLISRLNGDPPLVTNAMEYLKNGR